MSAAAGSVARYAIQAEARPSTYPDAGHTAPLGGAITGTAAIGLATMHVVAAAILIPLLGRSRRA